MTRLPDLDTLTHAEKDALILAAIAREMAAFAWAIAQRVEPAPAA